MTCYDRRQCFEMVFIGIRRMIQSEEAGIEINQFYLQIFFIFHEWCTSDLIGLNLHF